MERTKPVDNHTNREGLCLLRETVNKATRPITERIQHSEQRTVVVYSSHITTRRLRVTVLEQTMVKGRVILLFEYFWKKLRRKLWGTKGLKKNTQKGNGNDDNNTEIADLVLVRGLDGCYRGGGEDKKR